MTRMPNIFVTSEQKKYKNIPELYDYIPVEIASAGLAMMEIFFFISAFLLSYCNQGSVKSAMDIFVLLRKRVIRLTVPVFCLVAATIILPLLGDGPHWNDLLNDVDEIVENWPKYAFHYTNFIEHTTGSSIILNHLWFISALIQQILVAIPLLYINNSPLMPLYTNLKSIRLFSALISFSVRSGKKTTIAILDIHNQYNFNNCDLLQKVKQTQ
ncbi:uncharacterized protein LOC111640696 [Centruroides sculpturatus]|uniref:uncharacterized protein LOC111640696 n=1 Tax=Centruroides sculpturatus TaxID=218467 RepID=UPI000C6E8589|nr:uncharacterized protein LOC111640696 [Centruroides sculpturatus]